MLAIGLLLALHWFSLKYVKRRAMKFANYELMEKFTGEKILSKNYFTLILRVITLVFLVLAISGMVIVYPGHASSSDFVLAIDSSGSMLANDYAPDRTTAAKAAAKQFVDALPENTGVGVVAFAGISFVKSPVTYDLEKVKKVIENISVETVGGTAIGDAIVSSSNLLAGSGRSKTVVLLTDGQSNVGVTIEESLLYARQYAIVVHTIGIGTEEGGTLQNTTFVSKPDKESLARIANATGGVFYMAGNTTQLENAYQTIAASGETLISYDATTALLILALAFFFLEWFLTNTKYRTLP